MYADYDRNRNRTAVDYKQVIDHCLAQPREHCFFSHVRTWLKQHVNVDKKIHGQQHKRFRCITGGGVRARAHSQHSEVSTGRRTSRGRVEEDGMGSLCERARAFGTPSLLFLLSKSRNINAVALPPRAPRLRRSADRCPAAAHFVLRLHGQCSCR